MIPFILIQGMILEHFYSFMQTVLLLKDTFGMGYTVPINREIFPTDTASLSLLFNFLNEINYLKEERGVVLIRTNQSLGNDIRHHL